MLKRNRGNIAGVKKVRGILIRGRVILNQFESDARGVLVI
jgi:hypothetical protein